MNKNIQRLAGLILILAGLASYLLNPERPLTALIGPFVGVIILFLSIGLGRGRNVSFWASLALSILFGLMTANMAMKSYDLEDGGKKTRRIVVFWTMSIATLGNAGYLISKFKAPASKD
jgi:hypothetical protein